MAIFNIYDMKESSLPSGKSLLEWSFVHTGHCRACKLTSRYPWSRLVRAEAWHLLIAAFYVAFAPADSFADTRFWVAPSPGNLLTGSNWSGGVVPNGPGEIATFFTAPTEEGNFTLNGSMTLGGIHYSSDMFHAIVGSGQLMIDNEGSTANVEVRVGDGHSLNIFVPLSMAQPVEFLMEAADTTLNLFGKVSGSGDLATTGGGTVWLRNTDNSYSGLNHIQDGWLRGESIANKGVNSSFGRGDFHLRASDDRNDYCVSP